MKGIEAVRDVLTTEGRTVVQGALAWLWARSERLLPTPGFRTMEQADGLLEASDKDLLSRNDMERVDHISPS
jgi:aryl-alcohol dehydrogenase-like predicted oxidoreductase